MMFFFYLGKYVWNLNFKKLIAPKSHVLPIFPLMTKIPSLVSICIYHWEVPPFHRTWLLECQLEFLTFFTSKVETVLSYFLFFCLSLFPFFIVSSIRARALAEDAFFHPSIMSISYSSMEHYFAIYMVSLDLNFYNVCLILVLICAYWQHRACISFHKLLTMVFNFLLLLALLTFRLAFVV